MAKRCLALECNLVFFRQEDGLGEKGTINHSHMFATLKLARDPSEIIIKARLYNQESFMICIPVGVYRWNLENTEILFLGNTKSNIGKPCN